MQLDDVKKKIIELCEEKKPAPFNPISNWDLAVTFGENKGLVVIALTQLKDEGVVDFTHTSGQYQITGYHKPFGQ